jgi:hypothetical protein
MEMQFTVKTHTKILNTIASKYKKISKRKWVDLVKKTEE